MHYQARKNKYRKTALKNTTYYGWSDASLKQGNPKIGVVIKNNTNEVVYENTYNLPGEVNNNIVAEYFGFLTLIEKAIKFNINDISFYTDLNLIMDDLRKPTKFSKQNPLIMSIRNKILYYFEKHNWNLENNAAVVKGKENKEADKLSRKKTDNYINELLFS
jgi:hypothetical protein